MATIRPIIGATIANVAIASALHPVCEDRLILRPMVATGCPVRRPCCPLR